MKYFDSETQKKEKEVFSKYQNGRALSINSNMPYQQTCYLQDGLLYVEREYDFLKDPYLYLYQNNVERFSLNSETGKKSKHKYMRLEIPKDRFKKSKHKYMRLEIPKDRFKKSKHKYMRLEIPKDRFKKSNKKCNEFKGKRYQCYTAESYNNSIWIWVDTQKKEFTEEGFYDQFVFNNQLIVKKELYYKHRNVSRITILKRSDEKEVDLTDKIKQLKVISDEDRMYAPIDQNEKYETKPIKEGDVLPAYYYRDVDFKIQELNRFKGNGKYTLLEFWGTWCGPCLKAAPKLAALQKEFNDHLEILSFNCKDYKSSYVKKMISHKKLSWKQAFVTPKLLSILNPINRFPTIVLLDDHMKVILIGNPHQDMEQLKEIVSQVK
jgi:thiol-disulfide isomerase/thioredoxin